MTAKHSLKRFLNPKSIAVFGGGWAVNVITQLQKSGYQGDIWPVNPKREEILGIKCYPNATSLPFAPDAAFIGVNRDLSFDIVKDLSEAGAGGAICFASGFREAEFDCETQAQEGDRQDQLIQAADNMPLLGPNCYGFLNYLDNVTLWPDQHGGKQCDSGVAIIAQSSNIAINMTMQRRGLNISHMLTVGNQAQIGVSELAEVLLEDERVSTLGFYLESFNDIRAFEKMAQLAQSLGKSVVVLKIGKSLKAQIATVSHTASLAGNAAASSAFLKRLGIIEVDSISVFLETLKLLDTIGPLAGSRIASVSCSGGEASLMSDLSVNTRLEFPDFNEQRIKELAEVLGEKVTLANPLDYHTYIWGDLPIMTACFTAVMKEDLDLAVFILDIPRSDMCDIDSFNCAIEAIIAARQATDANVAVLATLGENLDEVISQRFLEAGIVPLHGMEEGIMAIDKSIFERNRKRSCKKNLRAARSYSSVFLSQPINSNTKAVSIDEYQAKLDLKKFGLPVPESSKVLAKLQIIKAAAKHRYPLALKGLGLEHKTEAGAVILSINSDDELRQASKKLPDCKGGYLIEEMVEKAIAELIIGVTRDDLGLFLLTVGAGGVLTEILSDTVSLLLPSNREEIANALKSLKMYSILEGYRGQDGVNISAIIDAVEAVSAYVEAHQGSLQELDINPLLAGKTSVTAVDALIRKLV